MFMSDAMFTGTWKYYRMSKYKEQWVWYLQFYHLQSVFSHSLFDRNMEVSWLIDIG